MKRLLSLAAIAATLALPACGGAGNGGALPVVANAASSGRSVKDVLGGTGNFTLSLSLYDAPLSHVKDAKVNIALLGVDMVTSSNVAYPVATYSAPRMVDLLTLQKAGLNFHAQLPADSYTTLRLLIDPTKSSISIGKFAIPLLFRKHAAQTASSVEEIDGALALSATPGEKVDLSVDFNVLESIALLNGSANVDAKLVVAQNGSSIQGKVVNAAHQAVSGATIQAVDGAGRVVNTTDTADDGSFQLNAVPAGSYSIVVLNHYVSASGTSVDATNADATAPAAIPVDVAPNNKINLGQIAD